MSAVTPIATKRRLNAFVRYVPIADIAPRLGWAFARFPNVIFRSNLCLVLSAYGGAVHLFYNLDIGESFGEPFLQKFIIGLLAIASLVIVTWTSEAAQTDEERICTLKLYPNYDPKRLDQCMDVCKSCRRGTTVTCSTSCKLKGARSAILLFLN